MSFFSLSRPAYDQWMEFIANTSLHDEIRDQPKSETETETKGWFHQTFSSSKKMPAHGIVQKIRRLISPTISKTLQLKLPN
jgi:hypothetical protein